MLSGRSLKELIALPMTLDLQKTHLAQETETLVYDNYKTFLQLAINISKTRRSVNETKVLQGSLQEDVRNLKASCSAFASRAEGIGERRAANRAMMQNYPQILELLEIPQLVEACVKSRSYEKALDLLHHSRKSLVQHPDLPVLASIVNQVKRSSNLMREQILAQLASDCDMETTIRSVDYLRRLDPDCDELELRKQFLSMREQWMESGKTAVPSSQLSRWLMGLAERLRTDLFHVVTQYRTLFSGGSEVNGGANLLWSFTFRKVNEFVDVLRSKMNLLTDGEEIGAVMEQTMYCGSSLSRVGLDFRILTHPIFEDCIRRMVSRRLDAAKFFFSESLRVHDWRVDSSAEWNAEDDVSSSSAAVALSASDALQPPSTLLKHPPLALFTNDLLDTLNHLRYCAVLSIADEFRAAFRATLGEASMILKSWGRMPPDSKQAQVYNDMRKELLDSMIPHIEAGVALVLTVPVSRSSVEADGADDEDET